MSWWRACEPVVRFDLIRRRDHRMHGWDGNTFGPVSAALVSPEAATKEASHALLGNARSADVRRSTMLDPYGDLPRRK